METDKDYFSFFHKTLFEPELKTETTGFDIPANESRLLSRLFNHKKE